MATIDSLDIQIAGSAKKANDAINDLITNLDRLAHSLKIDTSDLEKIGKSFNFSSIDKAAKNMQSQTQKVSKSLSQITEQYKDLGKGFEIKGSTQQIQKQIDALTNKLANAKLAKDDFETSGKTNLGGYETAVKNVIKYTNQIESLKNQLSGIKTEHPKIDFSITGIEEAGQKVSEVTEKIKTATIPQSAFNYNADAMKAVFGEAAAGIENWSQATQKFGANAGAVLNQTTSKADELKERTEQFEQSLKNLQIPPINTDNLKKLQREYEKATADYQKLKSELSNKIMLGDITANVDDKGYRNLRVKMVLLEKTADALKNKIKQVQQTSTQTSSGAKKLGDSVKSASKSFTGLANSSAKAIKPLNSLGNSFKSLIRTMLPILGIRQLFNWGKQSIEIASDLTEVQNVVDTTFGDMAYKVEDFAKTSIEQFGMSELSLKQYSSRFQAMGTAMGFPVDKMSDMSLELTKLTADMASFYNVEQKAVAEDLESIFTGTTKPLRQYGIDLTQATLQEWAMKNGLDANIQSMSQAEKTMLRYQYVLANTGAAHGDFARTMNTWANQVRILKMNFQQLAGIIGGVLVNAFKPVVKAVNAAMSHIISFAKTISNALGQIFGWKFEESGGGIAGDMEDAFGAIGDASNGAGDLSDKLGQAAENAKKLKTHTLGIDELNVVPKEDDLQTGAGGGGAGGTGVGAIGDAVSGALGGQWIQGDSILKAFESEIDTLYKLGEHIGKTLTDAMNGINWDSVYEKARNFGKGLADFLNGLISPELFGAIGKTIANSLNTAIYVALSFGETFDFYDFGVSIATGINEFFERFDFKSLAKTINTWANGMLDALITAIDNTNWDTIGKKIGTFLSEIDFLKITKNLAKALWKAINSAIKTYSRIFSTAPIETALISIAVFPKLLKKLIDSKYVRGILSLASGFKDLAEKSKLVVSALSGNKDSVRLISEDYPKLGKAVDIARQAFANFRFGIENGNFMTGLNEGIKTITDNLTGMQKGVIGTVSVFAEFSLVKSAFYDIASGSDNLVISIAKIASGAGVAVSALKLIGVTTPWTLAITAATGLVSAIAGVNKAYSEQQQIERYGDLLSNITSEINKNSEAIRKRAEESRVLVEEAGIAEATMASDLADKYFNLAEKENLTNDEKAQMQNLAKELVNTLPGLEEFYNTETGLIEATRDAVDEMIQKRLEQIRLSAVEERLKEAYTQQSEAIKEVEKAIGSASIVQEHMNELQDEYKRLNEKLEAVGKYKELSEQIASCEGDTSKLVEQQKALWNEITNNGKEDFPTYENLSAQVANATSDIKGFQGEYDEAMKTLANAEGAYSAVETNISELTSMLTDGMSQAAKDSVDGYNKGISDNRESSVKKTENWFQSIIDKARELLDSHSPSRVFKSLGEDSVSGYNIGIEENKSSAGTIISSMMKSVVEWMNTGIAPIKDSLPKTTASAWDGIKNVFTPVEKFFYETFKKGYNAIKTMFSPINTWFFEKWNLVKNVFKDVISFFTDKFTGGYNAVKNAFNQINTWFHEKWDSVKGVFRDVVQFFTNKFTSAYNAVKNAFNQINTWFFEKWNLVKNVFKDVISFFGDKFTSGYNAVKNAFGYITNWFGEKWNGIKNVFYDLTSWFSSGFQNAYNAVTTIWDGIKSYFAKVANWIIDPIQRAVNGVIKGINWVFRAVGAGEPLGEWTTYPRFASGSMGIPKNTIGMVNDQKGATYKELIVPPHGKPFIPEGRNVLLPLEKGTKIMPANQTKMLVNSLPNIPKFANGIGDFFGGAWEKITNFTGSVLDYIANPGKIVQIAIDKFTDFSNVGNFFIPIATSAINKLFDSVVKFVGKMFDSFGGAEKAVKWALGIAADNSHGYDQGNRWGNPDYDCSSLVISAFEQAGIKLKSAGATYTGNMYNVARGLGFTDVTSSVNLSTGSGMKRGDILLNRQNHTAMYIGNGQVVQASSNERGGIRGGIPGDQTGREINVSPYYNYPWDDVLRYAKAYKKGIGKINLSDLIPAYLHGGFPEDGLFFANHNELVGQFSNGQTVVGNNIDIQKGIEEAAYRGFSRANSENTKQEELLKELIRAVQSGKKIVIDGREIVSAYDERKTRNGYVFT